MSTDMQFTKANLDDYLMSDIVGILWEHQKSGSPISRACVDRAITTLYGKSAELPPISAKTIDDAFFKGDYERAYMEIQENEKQAKEIMIDFNKAYPGELKSENIDAIIEKAKQKKSDKATK